MAEWTSTNSRGDAQFEVCGGGDYLTDREEDLADRAVEIFRPNAQIPTLGFKCAKDSK